MKRNILFVLIIILLQLIACRPKEVPIGAVLPESGEAALYGQAIREGIQVAEDYVAAGQEFPYKFKVLYKDTQSIPENGVKMMKEAIKEGAVVIIGGVTSSEAFKMVEVADKRSRVLISPSASHAKLSRLSPHFFRTYPSDKQEVIQMAKFSTEIIGATKVAILYQNNDFGVGNAETYTQELKNRGILNTWKIELPANTDDFSSAISEVLRDKPDAVYIAAYSDMTIKALKALKNAGCKGKILTTSAINAPGAFARAGKAAEDIYFCKPPFDLEDKENALLVEFARRYEERFGKPPDVFSAYGFDTFLVVATAIKTNGTYPEDVYKGLKGLQGFKGVTGSIIFNSYGDVNKYPRIYWYTQGQEIDYMDYRKKERERILEEIEKLRHSRM